MAALDIQARGQASSKNLLPSEQFGLGGFNTVRGYQERLVNRDNAVCLNGELRIPSFSILHHASRKIHDDLTFLGFVDYGLGKDHQPVEGKGKWQPLLGVGPGARYIIGNFLTARIDWAFPLIKVGEHKKEQRLHFALVVNY